MHKRTVSTFLLFFSVFISLTAQGIDFNHFTPIQSSGKIPESFLKLSSAKVEEQKATQISGAENRKDLKAKEQFLLQSNFVVDEMLLSGRVLFNDPVGNYVNKVADYILRDQPELRSELQFYAVKSAAVNAFSTNQGVVFVNVGLISHLNSEAELAFVLCHEIQHYIRQHPINKYVESRRIVQGRGLYGNLSFNEMLLARNTFSREQETEADLEGLKLFLNTAYNPEATQGVFDALRDANFPFADVPFEKSFLETENLVFPDHYFLERTAPMEFDEDYEDSLTTHPNTQKRRQLVSDQIVASGKRGRIGLFVWRGGVPESPKNLSL